MRKTNMPWGSQLSPQITQKEAPSLLLSPMLLPPVSYGRSEGPAVALNGSGGRLGGPCEECRLRGKRHGVSRT
jgi:hypothetical protein